MCTKWVNKKMLLQSTNAKSLWAASTRLGYAQKLSSLVKHTLSFTYLGPILLSEPCHSLPYLKMLGFLYWRSL